MIQKIKITETLLSLFVLLGGTSFIAFLVLGLKDWLSIPYDFPWEGWALIWTLVFLSLSLILAFVAWALTGAYRNIRPLPLEPRIGMELLGAVFGDTPGGGDTIHADHSTLVTLAVKAWSQNGISYPVKWKLLVKTEDGEYEGLLRQLPGPVITNGNIIFEDGNSLLTKLEGRELDEIPVDGAITFIASVPKNQLLRTDTKLELSASDTRGNESKGIVRVREM